MSEITTKQFFKANYLKKMFEKFEQKKISIAQFCREEDIYPSKFYYWKSRYDKKGIEGLIDCRKGTSYNLTRDMVRYIQKIKTRKPNNSGIDIANKLKSKFGLKVSPRQIQRVLKESGLNDPIGRKPGKKILKKLKPV